jgi:hypothetical protein
MSVQQYCFFFSDADRLQLEGVPLDSKHCCVLCGREERPLVPGVAASRRLGRSLFTSIEELVGSDSSGSVPQAASSGSVHQADTSGSVPQAASSGSVPQADSSGNVVHADSTLVCPPCLRLIQVSYNCRPSFFVSRVILFTQLHCCGSGMFIPDPNVFHLGSEFFHPGSASNNLSILTPKLVSKISEI